MVTMYDDDLAERSHSCNNMDKRRSNWPESRMLRALRHREERGMLRRLYHAPEEDPGDTRGRHISDDSIMDFSSNDYLGLAHDQEQAELCRSEANRRVASNNANRRHNPVLIGATGSRLLSGDSVAFHALESYLAQIHRRPAALLCNSGYDANLTVVSSLPCNCIIYDEYAHNSLHMGMRLWKSQEINSNSSTAATGRARNKKECFSFRHNDVDDLRNQLRRHQQKLSNSKIVVLIESVYSMDGDVAPIRDMLDLCYKFDAQLVVDEAHGLGTFGRQRRGRRITKESGELVRLPGGTGVLAREEVEDHPSLLCSVHTFGKAAGCHGAVVCGSKTLKEYLVNYGYPLIYSTALPYHSLVTIRCSYETMTGLKGDRLREHVFNLVNAFRSRLNPILDRGSSGGSGAAGIRNASTTYLLPSTSPIQALMLPGNEPCTHFCQLLFIKSGKRILLYPIKSPTVPAGQERIRIIIHSHNTLEEVETLVMLIQETLEEMGMINRRSRL